MPDSHREPEWGRACKTEDGTRPPEGHSPRQQGRGTRRQQLWTPQRSHGRSERADGRHARTPQAAHSATRRAGRTAARQLKPRPQAAPQVGLAQAADARPDGQLAQALLPASARTTRHLAWAGDVIRQRKRQRGGAGAPPKKPKKAPPTDAAKGQERGELGGRLHVSTAHAYNPALCQADDVRADEDGRGRLRACDHHVHDCSSALARRASPGRGCRGRR